MFDTEWESGSGTEPDATDAVHTDALNTDAGSGASALAAFTAAAMALSQVELGALSRAELLGFTRGVEQAVVGCRSWTTD